MPPLRRLPPGETALAFTVTPDRLGFDTIDVAQQLGVSHHYWVSEGRAGTFTMPYRYVWPSELDLMARIAGMALRERQILRVLDLPLSSESTDGDGLIRYVDAVEILQGAHIDHQPGPIEAGLQSRDQRLPACDQPAV